MYFHKYLFLTLSIFLFLSCQSSSQEWKSIQEDIFPLSDCTFNAESIEYSFLAIGHAYGYVGRYADYSGMYKPLLTTLKSIENTADFTFFLGDLCEESYTASETCAQTYHDLRSLKKKYFLTPGNHDIHNQDDAKALREIYNLDSWNYSFAHKGSLFISLDSHGVFGKETIHTEVEAWKKHIRKSLESGEYDAVFILTHAVLLAEHLDIPANRSITKKQETIILHNLIPHLTSYAMPIFFISGDIGTVPATLNVTADSFFVRKIQNIYFLATGMGSAPNSLYHGESLLRIRKLKETASQNHRAIQCKNKENTILIQDFLIENIALRRYHDY